MTTLGWTVINLPGSMPGKENSWFDYTVGQHKSGSIALVQLHNAMLIRWVFDCNENGGTWRIETTFNLSTSFTGKFDEYIWQLVISAQSLRSDLRSLYSVHVRTTSTNGQFVYFTLGFSPGIYIADMEQKTIHEVPNIQCEVSLACAFALSEPWPQQI